MFEIPGPQQKASVVHKLKPMSRLPFTSGNPQDPIYQIYIAGSLGLPHNNVKKWSPFLLLTVFERMAKWRRAEALGACILQLSRWLGLQVLRRACIAYFPIFSSILWVLMTMLLLWSYGLSWTLFSHVTCKRPCICGHFHIWPELAKCGVGLCFYCSQCSIKSHWTCLAHFRLSCQKLKWVL